MTIPIFKTKFGNNENHKFLGTTTDTLQLLCIYYMLHNQSVSRDYMGSVPKISALFTLTIIQMEAPSLSSESKYTFQNRVGEFWTG